MRGFLAGVLAIAGLLLLPLADLGIWTQRELLPTDAFTQLATDVLHEPDVQQALATRLTTELVNREPALAIGRPLVQRAVVEGIGTPQFSQVMQASLGDMHDQLKRGDDTLFLNLDATLPLIKGQLAQIDPRLAASVPSSQVLPSITVVKRADAPELWEGVQIVRRAALLFPALAVVLLALAIAFAQHRARMLVVVGAALAVVALLLVLVIRLGRDPLSNVVGSEVSVAAFNAGYRVVTSSFVTQTVVLGIVGMLAMGGGAIGVMQGGSTSRPKGFYA
jgi:hypothetical protein